MPYKMDHSKIMGLVHEAICQVIDEYHTNDRSADKLHDLINETASDFASRVMDEACCDEDLELEIVVEGGCVQEVNGLPDGWCYKINDKD